MYEEIHSSIIIAKNWMLVKCTQTHLSTRHSSAGDCDTGSTAQTKRPDLGVVSDKSPWSLSLPIRKMGKW